MVDVDGVVEAGIAVVVGVAVAVVEGGADGVTAVLLIVDGTRIMHNPQLMDKIPMGTTGDMGVEVVTRTNSHPTPHDNLISSLSSMDIIRMVVMGVVVADHRRTTEDMGHQVAGVLLQGLAHQVTDQQGAEEQVGATDMDMAMAVDTEAMVKLPPTMDILDTTTGLRAVARTIMQHEGEDEVDGNNLCT